MRQRKMEHHRMAIGTRRDGLECFMSHLIEVLFALGRGHALDIAGGQATLGHRRGGRFSGGLRATGLSLHAFDRWRSRRLVHVIGISGMSHLSG
jgi:hypothetical protein